MVYHRPPRSGATRGLVHGVWRPVDRSARHRVPQHRERVFSRRVKRVREGSWKGCSRREWRASSPSRGYDNQHTSLSSPPSCAAGVPLAQVPLAQQRIGFFKLGTTAS
jgi:hypothetical protein